MLTVLCAPSFAFAQSGKSEQEKYKVDSVVYAYYARCKEYSREPVVMQMTDTLFRMAAEKGDTRMQAVALSYKVEHFYFADTPHQEDSLKYYIAKVMAFSKAHGEMRYYYFNWGQRLIAYYLRNHYDNLAFYEVTKMREEAESTNDLHGMQYSYSLLSRIYSGKNLYKESARYQELCIRLIEDNKLNAFGLTQSYSSLARDYIRLNELEKAKVCLDEAKKHISNYTHTAVYLFGMLRYRIAMNEMKAAKQTMDELFQLYRDNKELMDTREKNLLENAAVFYETDGQYAKALDYYRQAIRVSYGDTDAIPPISYRRLGRIYAQMHDYKQAAERYAKAAQLEDSINKASDDIRLNELNTIFDMERLRLENNDLERNNQQMRSRSRLYFILLLSLIVIITVFLFLRERLVNKRLKHANQMESNANRMKTEFIQNMSHEIRTPLNSIVGFSQILTAEFSCSDETKEYAHIIEQSSNNLLQLIDDVLDLSNLDSEGKISCSTNADVTTVCEASLTGVRYRLKSGVELTFNPEMESFRVQTNPGRLLQVLQHLLANACKFTEQGFIDLAWKRSAELDKLVFTVTDTGIGIPKEKQEFVFERFVKLDTFVAGTGLGLSICRLIAEKMNGTLHIDPDYAGGARFVLTLPLQKITTKEETNE
jgi:signal transduction histidine kinase